MNCYGLWTVPRLIVLFALRLFTDTLSRTSGWAPTQSISHASRWPAKGIATILDVSAPRRPHKILDDLYDLQSRNINRIARGGCYVGLRATRSPLEDQDFTG